MRIKRTFRSKQSARNYLALRGWEVLREQQSLCHLAHPEASFVNCILKNGVTGKWEVQAG